MRRKLAVVVVALITAQIVLAAPVAAADNTNCSNVHVVYTAGYNGPSGSPKHGVSGVIDGQVLHQCTNPGLIVTTGSFAWNALDGGGGSSGDVIMQLGSGECRDPGINGCDSGFHWYYAWGRDPSAPGCASYSHRSATPQQIGGYDGAAHPFKIYDQNGQWRFFISSTQEITVLDSDICWTPTNAVWFEEAWDPGDALGGSLSDPLTTASANYANTENGGFFLTNFTGPCSYPQSPPRYCSLVNSNTFNVWTNR